jgi:hypothetical protein
MVMIRLRIGILWPINVYQVLAFVYILTFKSQSLKKLITSIILLLTQTATQPYGIYLINKWTGVY